MTRRERIVLLLENYIHVVNGLRDKQGDGVHLPLMCRPWNKPRLGYPELERLRLRMRLETPTLYWHLRERYLTQHERLILACADARCTMTWASWTDVSFHQHGRRVVAVVPRVVRIVSPLIDDDEVEHAITWLDERWREPGPFLPDELKPHKVERIAQAC